jgi:hypothetical protein
MSRGEFWAFVGVACAVAANRDDAAGGLPDAAAVRLTPRQPVAIICTLLAGGIFVGYIFGA